jgi:hypothetical protein
METEPPEAGGWLVRVGGSAGDPEPPSDGGVFTGASYPMVRSRPQERPRADPQLRQGQGAGFGRVAPDESFPGVDSPQGSRRVTR